MAGSNPSQGLAISKRNVSYEERSRRPGRKNSYQQPKVSSPPKSISDTKRLRELYKLKEDGILTDEEFEEAKKKILKGL